MPEKYAEMVERWNNATEDELFPLYRPEEPQALQASDGDIRNECDVHICFQS